MSKVINYNLNFTSGSTIIINTTAPSVFNSLSVGNLSVTSSTLSNAIITNASASTLNVVGITSSSLLVTGTTIINSTRGVLIGSSTDLDQNRMISALNSTMAAGNTTWITLGQNNTSRNQAELGFNYFGNNNTANNLSLGLFGNATFFLTGNRFIGINNSNPAVLLDIFSSSTSGLITSQNITANLSAGGNLRYLYTGKSDFGAFNGVFQYYRHVGDNNPENHIAWDFNGYANVLVANGQGRVGLGTSAPSTTLDVVGSGRFTSTLFNNAGIAGIQISPTSNGAESSILFWQNTNQSGNFWVAGHNLNNAGSNKFSIYNSTINRNLITMTTVGNVGINNNDPTVLLDLGTNANNQILGIFNGGASGFYGIGANNSSNLYQTNAAHIFYIGSTTGQSAAALGTQRMIINSTGLGIGTNPSYVLDVNSSVTGSIGAFPGTNNVSGRIVNTATDGFAALRFENNQGSGSGWSAGIGGTGADNPYNSKFFIVSNNGSSNSFVGLTNGNWGINTNNPNTALDVNGTISRAGFPLPQFTNGTFTSGSAIPISFVSSSFNIAEIKIRYAITTNNIVVSIAARNNSNTVLSANETQGTFTLNNNTTQTTTSAIVSTNTANNVDSLVSIIICKAVVGDRNQYRASSVYTYSGIGATRGEVSGYFTTTALASIDLSVASGTITGSYSVSMYL